MQRGKQPDDVDQLTSDLRQLEVTDKRSDSYGLVLWMELRANADDGNPPALVALMQESFSADYPGDLKVDPLRCKEQPGETKWQTACRSALWESADLIDVTGEPLGHEVKIVNVFNVYARIEDPEVTMASLLADSAANFHLKPPNAIERGHLLRWRDRVSNIGALLNKEIRRDGQVVAPRLGRQVTIILEQFVKGPFVGKFPKPAVLRVADLPTVTLRRTVQSSGVVTFKRV